MDDRPPIPSMLLKSQVHKFAETVAVEVRYTPSSPMEPLLERLGGRLDYRPIFGSRDAADSIHVLPDGTFTIFVSGLTSAERDRFTIAHELGHYFLHFPLIRKTHPDAQMVATRWVDETNTEQRRAEWEANWFAAAFLMPAKQFMEVAQRCNYNLRALAAEFNVSEHAAGIRLGTLRGG